MKRELMSPLALAVIVTILAGVSCEEVAPTDLSVRAPQSQEPVRSYTFTVIDVPGAISTQGFKVNALGQLAGQFADASGTHGFVHRDGTFEVINVPGATNTMARSINVDGDIVGTWNAGGKPHGFLIAAGVLTTIDVPAANGTRLWDINDLGVLLGEYQAVAGGPWKPFTWSNGVITLIDVPDANMSAGFGLNNSGEVTGHFTRPGSTKMSGFRIGPSGFVTFSHPAAGTTMMSCGWGIGAKGEVVGHYQDPETRIVYGYLWDGDQFVDTLRVPAARETYPSGITSTGLVSGYFVAADNQVHAFTATPPGHPWGEKP